MKAEVQELFIYNETYPLPKDKYIEFKTRLSFCSENPMCVSRVKGDAETFIADWGKKNGSKLEEGDESGFFYAKEETNSPKVTKINEKKSNLNMVVALAIIVLAIFAIMNKNMTLGILTISLAMILFLV